MICVCDILLYVFWCFFARLLYAWKWIGELLWSLEGFFGDNPLSDGFPAAYHHSGVNRENMFLSFNFISCSFPIGSMYGRVSCIYHKNQPNVGRYAIHGRYGISFIVTPNLGEDEPNLTSIFFRWVGSTTNQHLMFIFMLHVCYLSNFPKASKKKQCFLTPYRGPSHGSRARRSHPFFRSLARRWVGPVSGF